MVAHLPACLASKQVSHMSVRNSGFSSPIDSPTVTNLSTAKLTASPTLASARAVFSVTFVFSLWFTSVVI